MMPGDLHPTPRGRDVVLEQVRLVGLRFRHEALVIAAILGVISIIIAKDIIQGTAATWFDSDDWSPAGFIAFFFPFAIWRSDRRFGAAFLWTLPVDRRRLALARVFAGWVWLMTALAVFISWERTLALFSGIPGAETMSPYGFIAATSMYLLGSALLLGLHHPLRWLLGTVGAIALLRGLDEVIGLTKTGESRMFGWLGLRWVDEFLRSRSLSSTIEDAAILSLLWLGAGLAALWAAVWRHGERRRH